jgi:type IV pilus assembly protein PilB
LNPPSARTHTPIGKYFLDREKITAAQLELALAHKQEHGTKLGQALVALGYVTEGEMMEALMHQGRFQCIVLTPGIVDMKVASRLSEKDSRRFGAVAINQIANHTTVAMDDPSDVYAIDELARHLESRIFPVFAEPTRIRQAIDAVFKRENMKMALPEASRSVDKLADLAREEEKAMRSGEDVVLEAHDAPSSDDVAEKGLDKPIINLVRSILEEAFVQGASDIHLETRRDDMAVRFRVDGTLFERTSVPKSWARPMIARIKVLANLDIAQSRLPQDGRVQFRYKRHRVDLRVATTPSLHGECTVMRVLDGGRDLHSLEDLDLSAEQLEKLERIITCQDGFVLATGPTGSGKTTTLYAILQRFVGSDNKIITLEDPVENEMNGVVQINANPKIGLTFAKGLRSILRQDPDIVLVGEIRDEETAQIAVQASLTGHIVLSTLHTVGAPETITRLTDMGIEPYLLADTLRGIVAQRLLRRVCNECKALVTPEETLISRLGLPADGARFFEGAGCEECHKTGYKGRVGVYEVMQMTPRLRRLIEQKAGTDALQAAALEEGLFTLRQDGLQKARSGLTTLHEVLTATSKG